MDLTAYGKPITIEQFNGLYDTGNPDDCPPDHSTECVNKQFTRRGSGVSVRDGHAVSNTTGHVVRRTFISAISTSLKPITLDDTGHLYLTLSGSADLTIANMIDFVGLNLFNKTYILPILSSGSDYLYVWDGTNPLRKAAGAAPTAGSGMSAADGASGNISAGDHKFAVIYETNTGFQTKPGPIVSGSFAPTSYTAPGSKKVDLSSIPTGPTGTSKRIIIGTKAGLEQYFFIPNAVINNNSSTTLTVDFLDTDLAIDASYLFNLLETIPAGTQGLIDKYHGRMIVGGGEGNLVRVSKSGDPESFDNTSGFIQLPDENDGNNVAGTFQLRDLLYFTKVVGIFQSFDNSQEPSSWGQPIQVEGAMGASRYGISTVSFTQAHLGTNDVVLLASLSGVVIFNGVATLPELTWKISGQWNAMVDLTTINNITICVDPFQLQIFISIGSFLFMGDYSDGLDGTKIKWSSWNWDAVGLVLKSIFIGTYSDTDSFLYALRVSFIGANLIFKIMRNQKNDGGVGIDSYITTSLLRFSPGMSQFVGIMLRVRNQVNVDQSVTTSLVKEDFTVISNPPAFTVSNLPGKEYFKRINLVAEKMAIRIRQGTVGNFNGTAGLLIDRIDIYGKKIWDTRPG